MSVSLAPEESTTRVDEFADQAARPRGRSVRAVDRLFRRMFLGRLSDMTGGRIILHDSDGEHHCGRHQTDTAAFVRVHNARLYRMLGVSGSLGAAEAYIRGYWDCDNLVAPMQILARQQGDMDSVESLGSRAIRPLRRAINTLRRNTRTGSKKNISAHYDLGNDFFELMLDPTMTYSAGVFESAESTMEDASIAKYDRIASQLQLKPTDHVVEIGCGWGGFAVHAASQYGCRVTATTISQRQFEYAKARVERAGLQDRVTLILKDYRDLEGQYDKLVSIEMIEAVGEKFLGRYLRQCSNLLASHGSAIIQAITMPDYRFEDYRQQVDFIQRYIFPGGFLPSMSSISSELRRGVGLQMSEVFDMTHHYAETLARWRETFWDRIDDVRDLGYDDRFIRTWNYYLSYCEAGFREHQIGVHQLMLTKPGFRRTVGG